MMNESFFAALKNYRYSHDSAQFGFGDRQSRAAGFGVEFEDYRNYAPGDDMRLVDWNVYGRLDQLYIRRFRSSGALKITIILDRSASMAFDSRKMLNALKLASALGYVGLNNSDTVRILPMPCLNESELQTFIGKKQMQSMFDTLEKTKIYKAKRHNKSLKFAYSNINSTGLTLIISDLQEDKSWFEFIKFLHNYHQRVFVFHVLSEQELQLPDVSGDIALSNLEFEEMQKIEVTEKLKLAFLQKFQEYLRRTTAFMHSNRVGYIKLSTETQLNGSFWQKLKSYGLWS